MICGIDWIQRAPLRYEITRRLYLLTRHQLHGTITGLAALRTMESSVDGLDRLLVSIKDAKVIKAQSARTQLKNYPVDGSAGMVTR